MSRYRQLKELKGEGSNGFWSSCKYLFERINLGDFEEWVRFKQKMGVDAGGCGVVEVDWRVLFYFR